MTLIADHNAQRALASVTAWRGESTTIDVLEILDLSGQDATVQLLNFNGTPLNWLGTAHGAAYVINDRVVFDADSAGEAALEVRVLTADGTEHVGSVLVHVQ